ncbi:MAG: tRNA preQ1(34) S-adenosylmethionine ribosyltransferase-isomerase QueA [Candidatus Omnitrophica bacterium]|nr:tRNA preQ1(34) S-adenosylmethionine ribosyltransferase-isomerase QueA [Candidatus Omnitrophota bacterium]
MRLSDFDYNLPKELIAQYPSQKRDESRLLVLHRDTGKIEHRIFKEIIEYFHRSDLLVLNDTKVVPARLIGKKQTGGKVEALVLDVGKRRDYRALLKPSRGCGVGSRLIFGNGELEARVVKREDGINFLRFECNGDFEELLEKLGKMPLPPYIKRESDASDKERYQTIYAKKRGAVAAPTAGLHFTKDLLLCISRKGVDVEYVTLHVGYGTFRPVKSEDITKHKMEKEYFEVKNKVVEKLRNKIGKTIAVGTTAARTLEAIVVTQALGLHNEYSDWTDLFIYPPYKFKAIDALLTNFHLPKTTLFMLVSAFCGRGLLFKAYQEAIDKKYRFYSYGDAMLIL